MQHPTQNTTPLTEAEIAALRELLEANRRWKWLSTSMKTWAVWLTAVLAATTIGIDALKNILKALG